VKSLEKTVRRHRKGKFVIVAHRVVNKILTLHMLGLSNSHFWDVKQDTCAIDRFFFEKRRFVAVVINDTSHMREINGWSRDDF
jgi:broad specificity phosphatase PhoE